MKGHCLVIGLTGVIGSGKSLVLSYIRDKGIPVLDSDRISRELMEPGKDGWLKLKEEFGDEYFKEDNSLDRQKLRNEIFCDQSIREKIKDIAEHACVCFVYLCVFTSRTRYSREALALNIQYFS